MNDDLKMMTTPDAWPRWPLLPLKRRRGMGMPDTACLYADGTPTLLICNLFDTAEKKLAAPKKTYPDFKAIVEDGWVVD
jgi:hypothetical protein